MRLSQWLESNYLSVASLFNSRLWDKVTSLERPFWANNQYNRRECFEIIRFPKNLNNRNLKKTTLKFREEINLSTITGSKGTAFRK